jgi:CRP-like cAMP-binding protein
MKPKICPDDEIIFEQGDEGDRLYVIVDGSVSIFMK